jgi:hypothetical protein
MNSFDFSVAFLVIVNFGLLLFTVKQIKSSKHRRRARGGQGLPKVSLGLAMPYPSMPCRRATPVTALRPFQGRLAAVFYLLGHPTRTSMEVKAF